MKKLIISFLFFGFSVIAYAQEESYSTIKTYNKLVEVSSFSGTVLYKGFVREIYSRTNDIKTVYLFKDKHGKIFHLDPGFKLEVKTKNL